MIKIKALAVSAVATALLLSAQSAQAHCDSLDGPVAKAALAALETGNLNLALPYAPPAAEPEMRLAFVQSLKVRTLGPDAKALADHAFIETAVRLHRAGEGAAYTGLKPAGIDQGPAIPAAEHAVATGDPTRLEAMLVGEVRHSVHERLARATGTQSSAGDPRTPEEVAAARQRVGAELGFVTYVEGLHQAIRGGHEHKE